MLANDRLKAAHDIYGAYVSGDRRVVEELLSDDFVFYSPADVGIGPASYFERCWPNAESGALAATGPRAMARRIIEAFTSKSGSLATLRSTRSP